MHTPCWHTPSGISLPRGPTHFLEDSPTIRLGGVAYRMVGKWFSAFECTLLYHMFQQTNGGDNNLFGPAPRGQPGKKEGVSWIRTLTGSLIDRTLLVVPRCRRKSLWD